MVTGGWVSHLAGSAPAAPRDYFTALRIDIISVEERERDGCNEWDTVISTSFAQQLFSVWPLNVVIVDFPCVPARLLGDSQHQGSCPWLPNASPFPWWSFRRGAPTHFVIFLIHLCCQEPVGVNVLLPQAAAQGGGGGAGENGKKKGKGKEKGKTKKKKDLCRLKLLSLKVCTCNSADISVFLASVKMSLLVLSWWYLTPVYVAQGF